MKAGADQKLEAMLVSISGAGTQPRRAASSGHRRRGILDIVLWSAITNIVLLSCFAAGWNFERIRTRVAAGTAGVAEVGGKISDPLAVSRYDREDNELLTRGPQRQLKGPLQLTLIASAEDGASEVPEAEEERSEQDQGDGAGTITLGPEDPAAMARIPLLRKGARSGEVVIGSFATVSMPGSSMSCLDTVYGLLEDAGAHRDKLMVLAESPAITVARICALNGSLVVTCRLDQITISPRRPKPNETCMG